MKRILLFCSVLVLLFCTSAEAAMTYGADYYRQHKQNILGGSYQQDPIWLFMTETETTGMASFVFVPGLEPSTPNEGEVYYDESSNGLLLYNGSAWVSIDVAGASSLDTAYGISAAVTVDAGSITLTATDAANNAVLTLVQSDTGSTPGLVLTNAGTGPTIQIDGSSTGDDITGTGDTWTISEAGVGTFAGLIVGSTDFVFSENGEAIRNDTNLEFEFYSPTATTEDFSIGLGTNTNIVTFSSDSGATSIAFDTIDDLTGIGNVYFDAAASTITLAASGDAQDLTVQVTGAHNSSLDLRSAGTGDDAIKVYATAGGIDVDTAGGIITMTSTADGAGDDITIEVDGDQNASIILTSDGTGGDAISLITSAATGDIKVASADEIDIDSVGSIYIDLSEAGANLDVDSAAGSIFLDAGEADTAAVTIIASATAGGMDIDSGTAGIAIDTTGAFSIDGAAASNVSVVSGATDENLTISVTGATASSLILSSAGTGDDAVDLNATAGGLDVDTAKSIVLTSAENEVDAIVLQATLGGIQILCDAASATEDITIANTGGSVNVTSSEAADDAVKIYTSNAAGQIHIVSTDTTADGINVDATGGIDIDAGITSDIALNAGQILIESEQSAASAISLITNTGVLETIVINNMVGTDDASINIDSVAGGMDIDVAGPIGIDNSGAAKDIHIDSAAGSVQLIGGQAAADAVVIDAENAAGGLDIDAGTAGINMLATAGDITITNTDAKDIILDAQAGRVLITGTESASDAIALVADGANGEISLSAAVGGIDIDAASGPITIDAAGAAGDLITIKNTTGTGASATTEEDAAIQLYAPAGGIALTSGLSAADAIRIETQSSGSLLTIQSAAGTNASAIGLIATAGGITASVADGKSLKLGNAGADAYFEVAAHATPATEYVNIVNTNGTAATAINMTALAGGINATVNDGSTLKLGSEGGDTYVQVAPHGTAATEIISVVNAAGTADGAIVLTSTSGGVDINSKEMFTVTVAGGTAASADITLLNSTGTDAAAIALTSSAGGVDIDAAAAKEINIAGGSVALVSKTTGAGAISLTTNIGTAETIAITNSAGTGTDAINIDATLGGIDLDAKEMFTVNVTGGTAASADITLTNTPGTDEAAISLQAVAGGVDINAALAKNVAITGGQVLIDSLDNAASAIALTTNVGTSETIVVTNTLGNSAAAIDLTSSAGGVTVTAAKPLKLEAALAVNDVQTIGQDDATPDVSGYSYFNTGTNADTIDDFDGTDIEEGQIIIVVSKAAITYDVDGGALIAGTTDLVTASGDVTVWMYDGTNWLLLSWIDNAADQNGKG
uniref:Uncharacterized protein n=1 Tax=viral metagenome TaxID=1070528 RepID=A0A6M3KMB5_9ZZZZ